MNSNQIRQKYLDFMEERGHKIVSSASLLPENDPTTLFTGSGMQPMVPYLLGEKYPGGEVRIANSQKCFRTGDIEEVGDNRHTTFFEMLGNWSLGDYFKKEQIEWMFEFLTKELKLDPKRIYVSVYRGNEKFKLDKEVEAVEVWQGQFKSVGIEAETVDFTALWSQANADLTQADADIKDEKKQRGPTSPVASSLAPPRGTTSSPRIFYYPDSENWWSRAGGPSKMPEGEPGGPDSEMFWDFGPELGLHEKSAWKDQPCHPACDCGRFVEIGNNVFMQYKKVKDGFEGLKNKNIDFGGGLERLAMAVEDTPDIFKISLFDLPLKKLEELSNKKYGDNSEQQRGHTSPVASSLAPPRGTTSGNVEDTRSMRVILDHLRAATFLINDGAEPSNKDQGYFTRRLIRRAVRFGHQLGIEDNFTKEIAKTVIETYGDYYIDLVDNEERIYKMINDEEKKFKKTLGKGLHELESIKLEIESMNGKSIFDLYQSYGFPIEMSLEELEKDGIKINKEKLQKEFGEELQKHKDLSRTASAGKFKGGLAGDDKVTTQLHTITHLMLAGLREVLGGGVTQKGSNITPERIRFDFSYDQAMTDEQKAEVEKFVNKALRSGAKVELTEMAKQQAMDEGVTGAFWEKYPDQVKVYTVADSDSVVYSKELCGGPHIESLNEIKGEFQIIKEKSSGAGVRRIKATIK